jgi:hypothetical protein
MPDPSLSQHPPFRGSARTGRCSYALIAFLSALPICAFGAELPCETLKSRIEATLQRNGVKYYTLTTIPTGTHAEGKIVGSCDGGRHNIVYYRSSLAQISSSAQAPSQSPAPLPAAAPGEYQLHIRYCLHNTTGPDQVNCPEQYAVQPQCLAQGGRTCLILTAKYLALHGECDAAFGLTLVCQCNNAEARRAIVNAGATNVCSFLREVQ